AGIDEISYADRTGTVRVTLVGGVDDGAAGEADSVVAVENARGGAGKDTLIGTAGANVLSGSAGNDTITDGLGPDVVLGGDGDDVFLQGAIADPNDEFTGGLGADTISYASRATATRIELHNGQLGNGAPEENDSADQIERATGGSGDDNIVGDGFDNLLRGGAGNDSIVALAGADTLHGDAGDDQLDTTDGTGGNDVSHGGPGDDVFFHDVGDITNQ
ncbi:calcium-binding protein, partial [Nocardioides stalactiti]|uniref:calcium-binding protein n=1 Tax=Nocardioides stalactiti TaxID=2755356 RepID=UPI0035E40499